MARLDTKVVSLADLLVSKASRSSIKRALKSFECERNDDVTGYLLAQIARDGRYSKEDYDCLDLIEIGESRVREAIGYVGGRIIYLDCKEPLVAYYGRQGYEELCYDSKRDLHKMLKCA